MSLINIGVVIGRRRKWQPTPVFLPGASQGQRSLVGCRLRGRTGSDTTEAAWRGSGYQPPRWPPAVAAGWRSQPVCSPPAFPYCGSVWPQRPPSAPVPASRPDVCAEPRLLSHGFNCPVIFSRSWSFTPSLPRGLHRGASGVLRVFPIRQPLQAGPGGLFSQECGWWGSEATLPPWRPRAPEAPDTLPSFPWPLQWCEIRVGK